MMVKDTMAITIRLISEMANLRFFQCRWGLRSKKGSRKRASTAAVGRTTVPTHSIWPGKYLSISNKNKKYHSGRGIYDESLASAGGSFATPRKIANPTSRTKMAKETSKSL